MTIRTDQMRELASEREAAFVRRMVCHLRQDLAADCERQGLNAGDLEPFVRLQMRCARGYGIESARDLKTYIDCAAVYGRSFDDDPKLPWAAEVLQRPEISSGDKADILHDHLVFRD